MLPKHSGRSNPTATPPAADTEAPSMQNVACWVMQLGVMQPARSQVCAMLGQVNAAVFTLQWICESVLQQRAVFKSPQWQSISCSAAQLPPSPGMRPAVSPYNHTRMRQVVNMQQTVTALT